MTSTKQKNPPLRCRVIRTSVMNCPCWLVVTALESHGLDYRIVIATADNSTERTSSTYCSTNTSFNPNIQCK